MNKLSWIGRCTVLHLLAYLVVALPTGLLFSRFFLQGGEALRFFEFFFVPHLGHLVGGYSAESCHPLRRKPATLGGFATSRQPA